MEVLIALVAWGLIATAGYHVGKYKGRPTAGLVLTILLGLLGLLILACLPKTQEVKAAEYQQIPYQPPYPYPPQYPYQAYQYPPQPQYPPPPQYPPQAQYPPPPETQAQAQYSPPPAPWDPPAS